jgi:hypothetical protein
MPLMRVKNYKIGAIEKNIRQYASTRQEGGPFGPASRPQSKGLRPVCWRASQFLGAEGENLRTFAGPLAGQQVRPHLQGSFALGHPAGSLVDSENTMSFVRETAIE